MPIYSLLSQRFMNTSEKVVGGIVAVVVVVAAIFAFMPKDSSTTPAPTNASATNEAITNEPTTGEAMGTPTNTAGSTNSGSATNKVAARLSTADAVKKYPFHLFFTADCNVTGDTTFVGGINIKQKTQVLLSNTDSRSHKISVGNNTVTVAGEDYQIVTMPTVKETTGIYLMCDGKSVGRIYVQP